MKQIEVLPTFVWQSFKTTGSRNPMTMSVRTGVSEYRWQTHTLAALASRSPWEQVIQNDEKLWNFSQTLSNKKYLVENLKIALNLRAKLGTQKWGYFRNSSMGSSINDVTVLRGLWSRIFPHRFAYIDKISKSFSIITIHISRLKWSLLEHTFLITLSKCWN